MLPYSESCERNQDYILERLASYLSEPARVLEIGSGTGQHAVHFTRALTNLTWICSDLPEYLPGIQARIDQQGTPNIEGPLRLDVAEDPWPASPVDAVFTANSLHIMSQKHVVHFFRGVNQVLDGDGALIVYGPFRYGGKFTTQSNANFDVWLKRRDPMSGVRDFEEINKLADQQGLALVDDHKMPANNQFIIWKKNRRD